MAAQGKPDPTALLLEFIQIYGDGSGQLPTEVRKKIIMFTLRDIALPEVNDLSGLDIPYKYVQDTYNAIEKNKGLIKEAVIAAIEAGLAAYFAAMKVMNRAFPGGVIPVIQEILHDSEGAAPHRTQAAQHHAAHLTHPYHTQHIPEHGIHPHHTQAIHPHHLAHPGEHGGHEHHYEHGIHPHHTQGIPHHLAHPGEHGGHHFIPEHGAAPHHTQLFGIDLSPMDLLMKFITKYADGQAQLPPKDRKLIVHFIINAIGVTEINDISGLKIKQNYVEDIYNAMEKETVAIRAAVIAAIKAGLKAYEAAERIILDAFPGGLIPAIEMVLHKAEGEAPHRTQAAHHYHTQHGAPHPYHTQHGAPHPYHTQHGAPHPYHTQHGAPHPYHTEHGASHPHHTEHGASHPYHTQHGAPHPYHTQAASHVPTYGPCSSRPHH